MGPLRAISPVVLCALEGSFLGGDGLDELGALELQGLALRASQGAGLVELGLAVPLLPDLHPGNRALGLEAVLHRPLAPDPAARVVVAEGLLESPVRLEFLVHIRLWRCLWREGG